MISWISEIRDKPIIDVRTYGATLNGTTNDTSAVAAAISAVTASGGSVLVPEGICLLTPDTITIPNGVNFYGLGQGNTTLIPASTGTALLRITGTVGKPNEQMVGDFKIDISSQSALSGIDVSTVNNGNIERVFVSGGTYGIRLLTSATEIHLRNIRIFDASGTGLWVNGDSCAELFYDDIDIGKTTAGTMSYGVQIVRTTLTDVGAHYMKRVRVIGYNAGSAYVTNGIAVTAASASADTGTIIIAEQTVLEQINGPCLSLQKASIVIFTGGWFATTSTNDPTIKFDGSDNVSIVNCTITNSGAGSIAAFVVGSPLVPSTLIRFVANRFGVNTGVIFSVNSGNAPEDLIYQSNTGITDSNLTNSLSVLQGATSQTTSKSCAVNVGTAYITTGAGSPNGSVVGNPGDLYFNQSGGSGTTLYVKESGVGTNTGWVGK